MKFPEEYKNTVCCIKCRKLGIEYTGKNKFRYCKECNSHVYIYNEIPIQKDPESAKKLCLGAVIVTLIFLLSQGISTSVTFFTTIFVAFFSSVRLKLKKTESGKLRT